MARVRYSASSELTHSEYVELVGTADSAVFWRRVEAPVIEPDSTDILHIVADIDRLDNLAAFYYGGRSDMKWVIARANGIRLEPLDLIPGVEIRIPTQDRLRREGIVKG